MFSCFTTISEQRVHLLMDGISNHLREWKPESSPKKNAGYHCIVKMLWNPAICFGDRFTLAILGRWHFCQPIIGLATAHFGAGQGESQWGRGWRNSVVFLCIFASKIWISSLKLPPRLIKFIQEVQADQTLPIPSRESCIWIILRTILCLVDWTSRVSWFLINLPTWIWNEVALSPLQRKFTEKGFRVWETFFPCVSFSTVIRLALTSCHDLMSGEGWNLQTEPILCLVKDSVECQGFFALSSSSMFSVDLHGEKPCDGKSISSHHFSAENTSTQPTSKFLWVPDGTSSSYLHQLPHPQAGCVKKTHDETSLFKAQKPL